jgi:membrane protein DedA with SNARE-associated domain
MSIEEMIARYGYFALFAGVVIEGETVLIAASFAAHQGYLQVPWVIAVAFMGAIAGDQFYFFLGREKGRNFLKSRPLWQMRLDKMESLLQRHHRPVIVGFRFIYGLRSIAPFAIGMSEIRTVSFILFDAISALAWSLVMGGFGFLLGTILEALLVDVKRYERQVLLAVLVTGGLIWMTWYLRKRSLERNAEVSRTTTHEE